MYSPISGIYYKSPSIQGGWNGYLQQNYSQRNARRDQPVYRVQPQYWNSYYSPNNLQGASLHFGNPYPIQPSQGYPQPFGNQQIQQPSTNHSSYSNIVFQNPLLASEENQATHTNPGYSNQEPYFHPYPKASFLARPPSGVSSVLNSFKSQDGKLDINKMVDTAGQMINAVSQVSTVVKGLGGMFKV
ncbi:YppG family protein [Niallia sp. Krafla_26]|uniref:YppG family protein n=1 Tax=Niallia sp. Krafla_26 TaxID=3064703 RepID=UPI003D17942B